MEKDNTGKIVGTIIASVVVLIVLGMWLFPIYGRFQTQKNNNLTRAQTILNNNITREQAILNEQNQVQVNEIKIKQTEQLVQVEQQKADIRVVEAKGIAQAQQIINATLTDKYLQHEAITSQSLLANSPNHTTVYIPSGQNGIPLVKTLDN